jgi:hypothetical protein
MVLSLKQITKDKEKNLKTLTIGQRESLKGNLKIR